MAPKQYILFDFHKNVFWIIIWFPAIMHSYNQDYVDQEGGAVGVEYSSRMKFVGKLKFLILDRCPVLCSSLHTVGKIMS